MSDYDCDFPVHYRFYESCGFDGIGIVCEKFYPIRETECFYFVLPGWMYSIYKSGNMPSYAKSAKRVSKSGRVRRCYPKKEDAFKSFIIRKNKQIDHAKRTIDIVSAILDSNPSYESLECTTGGRQDYEAYEIGRKDIVDKHFIFD